MYSQFIEINWKEIGMASGLSETETRNLFSDGRVAGEFLQKIAIKQFNLWEGKNCSRFDAMFPKTQKKIEIRLVTRRGLSTAPSNQIGSKRRFDPIEYSKKLEYIDYFLLIDLRTIDNKLSCYLIPSSSIRRFFIKGVLSKSGATASHSKIALILRESIKFAWIDGI